jgi:Rps23 Pro-64 3,4-dihydroxylase Tpa1-like proline 4-hydroxylase
MRGRIGPTHQVVTGNFLPWEDDFPTIEEPQVSSNIEANFDPNIEHWRNVWAKTNACVIPDFLDNPIASEIQQYYFNQPKDFWDLAVFPDPFGHYEEGEYPLYRCKPNDPSIPDRIKYTLDCNDRGEFAYMYRRTENYHPHLEVFSSPQFISQLEYITGYENLQFNWDMTFISCYEPGHFNGPHTDGMNGRIAFVYHLSPDWKPWNGGLFARMDDEWKKTTALVVPDFNKFTMFNVFGDGYGAPHLVTEVAQGCTKKRISYTGWYQ